MEYAYLKKHTRSHKYLSQLSKTEINAVLNKYVPRLRSIQLFFDPKIPLEIQDEYQEKADNIVQEAKDSLNFKLKIKIEKKYPCMSGVIVSALTR